MSPLQYVAMEVINPEHIDCTLDQIGGNERVKKDLVGCSFCLDPMSASVHERFPELTVTPLHDLWQIWVSQDTFCCLKVQHC